MKMKGDWITYLLVAMLIFCVFGFFVSSNYKNTFIGECVVKEYEKGNVVSVQDYCEAQYRLSLK